MEKKKKPNANKKKMACVLNDVCVLRSRSPFQGEPPSVSSSNEKCDRLSNDCDSVPCAYSPWLNVSILPESTTQRMPSVSTAMPWTNCRAEQLPISFISHEGNGSISGSVRPLLFGVTTHPNVAGTPGCIRGNVKYNRFANALMSDMRLFRGM